VIQGDIPAPQRHPWIEGGTSVPADCWNRGQHERGGGAGSAWTPI